MTLSFDRRRRRLRPLIAGAGVWLVAWLAMIVLDGHVDLGNQALLLVLGAALAALWLPAAVAMIACAAAVMAFNYAFVPPRGEFAVDLEQHALLLGTMLAVSWLVSLLVERQRRLAANERRHRLRAEQLRALGEALRDADDPRTSGALLQRALAQLVGGSVAVLLLEEPPTDAMSASDAPLLGPASADERVALWLCMRAGSVTGGPAADDDPRAWYLPIRGRRANFGAALLRLAQPPDDARALREHTQALCDQMGVALERASSDRAAARARAAEEAQALRTTLLAAVAHDHRTPLATILGAGSSLLDQGERMTAGQRHRLAATVVEEATQLARLTDNTLQLARLGGSGVALHFDWESAEELVGAAVRRMRQRDSARTIDTHLEDSLPLLRCDAPLLIQLLDNLIDNAFKYGGGTVEVVARREDGAVVIAVRDRGPGVPPEWRERIFEPFQRAPQPASAAEAARPGAGVGLAVCRAVARAHGGELVLRERAGGGSSFELSLPIEPMPSTPREPGGREP